MSEQAARGSHFAAPTDGSIEVAEELRRRFGLPQWRFSNSGTESTMAAIHLARGATGRDVVLKMEGSYHGHHDSVMVSVRPPLDQLGDRDEPSSLPFGAGHPDAIRQLTKAVPFNDADRAGARAGALRRRRGDPRAGDDEHHDRRAARRLPGSACASCATPTARS